MTTNVVVGSRSPRPASGRFAIVAVAATAIDVGLVLGLDSLGLPRAAADLIALAAAAVVSFRLHSQLTLRGDKLDRWIRQLPVFVVVATVAGVVDLTLFIGLGRLATLPAKLIAVAVAALVRALFHRFVLFRAVRRDQSLPVVRGAAPGGVRLSVVIPAYGEESRIATTIERIRDELIKLDRAGELEVVVVDDGSADRTAHAATEAGADVVVVQPFNQGKGAAVRAGAAAASGRTIAFTDADLAYSPTQLMAFLEAVESGYDVAIGNRHHLDTETLKGTSSLRSFGSRVVNMATQLLLLGSYRDTQCGCKAFRSDAAGLVLGVGIIDGFAFDIEVLHLVERYGLTMIELPVEVVNSDTSTVRAVRDGIGVLLDIFVIRRAARRGRYSDPVASDRMAPPVDSDPTFTDPTAGGQ